MSRFDFSSFYLNTTLSDVVIVIRCKNDYGDVQVEELPSHGIVLANVSQLFKRQIELQSKQHALGNPAIITLDCTADQVSAARWAGECAVSDYHVYLHLRTACQLTDSIPSALIAPIVQSHGEVHLQGLPPNHHTADSACEYAPYQP